MTAQIDDSLIREPDEVSPILGYSIPRLSLGAVTTGLTTGRKRS